MTAIPDTAQLDGLRRTLAAANYTEEGIAGLLGGRQKLDPGPFERPLARRTVAGHEPLGTLVRLFLLHDAVAADEAADALDGADLGELEAAGILQRDDDLVRARVRLSAHGGQFVASDPRLDPGEEADFVPGMNPSTRTISALVPRRPVATSLDLACGSGALALSMALHSREVTATDVNARALGFARLGAALNGIDNVTFTEGSWLEPVGGRRFELVVCNPPFVISPDTEWLFRDGDETGDGLSRGLVRAVPRHLEPGGVAVFLCNWIHSGSDWTSTLRDWVSGTGCDALLLHWASQDPLAYASTWNARLRASDPDGFGRTVDRWVEHYAASGIERIGWGGLVLRRREGESWVRALDVTGGAAQAAGTDVVRLIEAQDHLPGLAGDEPLLAARLRAIDGCHLQQNLTFGPVRWSGRDSVLRMTQGLPLTAPVAAEVLPVVLACDGKRTLSEMVEAGAVGSPPDEEALHQRVLPAVRELIGVGLLEVV